jgi:hypothetical protein
MNRDACSLGCTCYHCRSERIAVNLMSVGKAEIIGWCLREHCETCALEGEILFGSWGTLNLIATPQLELPL